MFAECGSDLWIVNLSNALKIRWMARLTPVSIGNAAFKKWMEPKQRQPAGYMDAWPFPLNGASDKKCLR